jgi:hypothetical protein
VPPAGPRIKSEESGRFLEKAAQKLFFTLGLKRSSGTGPKSQSFFATFVHKK